MPHGVTVSASVTHWGSQFVTGARALSLQLAAASYIYIHYAWKKKRKERWWWQRQLYTSRELYRGSSLLADLNFQSVSGLYKNFTRMSPSDFELLINLIGKKKSRKRTQRSGKPFLFKKVWHWRYNSWQVVILTLAFSNSLKFPSNNQLHRAGSVWSSCWKTEGLHTGKTNIILFFMKEF